VGGKVVKWGRRYVKVSSSEKTLPPRGGRVSEGKGGGTRELGLWEKGESS